MMRRRDFLKSTVLLAAAFPALWRAHPATAAVRKPEAFDFARLKGQARALAAAPYQPPQHTLPKPLAGLDYDEYQAIRFRADRALWARESLDFRAGFFHRGPMFKEPVRMYEVMDGQAQEIVYDPAMFDFSKSGINVPALPKQDGFAGLRLHFHTDWSADVAVFLGASYFRAVGEDFRQYGISARGLAIDTALDHGEEFPIFTAFWLERPAKDSGRLSVYALLNSPQVAGSYRFDITPGAMTVMDVDAALYPRKPIQRLGVAPLTSMFQCGENDRRVANDWRPEIHDSDGLSLWRGNGEWIWRPLVNPAGVRVNSYFDENPRGFGLLQRDRSFDHYQDDGAYYHRRPSLWVEPKATASGGWGKGAVQLVELPAADETFDNIVAFWNPADKPQPGQELLFSYRLHWGGRMPFAPPLAQVVATRAGIGGVVGQKRKYFSWRFAVDFAGGQLAALPKNAKVEPVISASRGQVEITSARPQLEINGYRAMFDLRPADDSTEPVDVRLYLRINDQPLTETWIYQWTPPPPAERKY
jgi:periplasmic glucans biosynthesis protein